MAPRRPLCAKRRAIRRRTWSQQSTSLCALDRGVSSELDEARTLPPSLDAQALGEVAAKDVLEDASAGIGGSTNIWPPCRASAGYPPLRQYVI
jgi:hypothetical protein